MKIVILAMDDPLYTNDFIKEIIRSRKKDIILYAQVTKGDRMTIGRDRSKLKYLISLFFIMGFINFTKNVIITIFHKLKKNLCSIGLSNDPTVFGYTMSIGIASKKIENPNSKKFCSYLTELNPDIIINQSQTIIKKRLLSIPKIGILNRHNALLPKNRGRLTPFWVLYKREKETGVSIHFVEESLDSGDIIVQKKFAVNSKDNFNTIVKKNYAIAGKTMLEAIEKLEDGFTDFIKNDDSSASYNTIPTLKEAWEYRRSRILGRKSFL